MAQGLIPGQTTLAAMRRTLRQRTMIVNNQVCTDQELDDYLASSQTDLYDLLIGKMENWAISPDYLFYTDGNTDAYPLPSNFLKLYEVHLQWSASPTGWTRIRRTEMSQVTRYTVPNMVGYYGATDLHYVIRGQTTAQPLSPPTGLVAVATTGGTLAPSTTYVYQVTATTSVGETIAGPATIIALGVSDTAVNLTWNSVAGASGYNVYAASGGDVQFIASTTALAFTDNGSYTPNGALPVANTAMYNGPSLWLMPRAQAGQTIRLIYIPRLTTPTDSGTAVFNGLINGTTLVFQGVTFTAKNTPSLATDFAVGATDDDTAANLVTVFNTLVNGASATTLYGMPRDSYVASAEANVVTISLAGSNLCQPVIVQWSAPTNISLLPGNTWSNIVDGVNGWEEYIIVDAAIKVQDKQDLDSAPFVRRKQQILDRIEVAASSRDAGSPKTVVDTMGLTSSGWGWGGGNGQGWC